MRRCDARGMYKKGAESLSLLHAICGDSVNPFSFPRMYSEGGTTLHRFYFYMSDLISWLNINRPGQSFCFTMDNLNIHKHQIILDLIDDAGHRVLFRALYWSCDRAIEYVFNTIHTKLQMDDVGVTDINDLMTKIDDIIFEIDAVGYEAYFLHVGFGDM